MKKKSRYPKLATAIAAALMSAQSAYAGTKPPAPAPLPARAGVAAPHLSEAAKIEALIASVEHLPGAVFIRNGTEYDAVKAAAHLRRKLDYAGKRIQTAEQFIEKLASESSMTGKPYKIRYADGHSVDSAVFFHEQLRRLEAPPQRKTAAKG